jgi:hypothetical protein
MAAEPRKTIIPPQTRIMNTTGLLIAMTTGLCNTDFLKLAELIAGRTEWRENEPRPCLRDWTSLENGHAGKNIEPLAEKIIVGDIGEMVKSQQPEAYALISELRKYLGPLDRRDYPLPADDQIEIWEENGVMRHNVKILNKRDELTGLIDPIRRRAGFPERLAFRENEHTRAKYNYVMEHFDTMNSIIFMDSIGPGPKNERDAVPRLSDDRLARLVGETFAKQK